MPEMSVWGRPRELEYEEAEELELKVLDLHKRMLGPEHLDTLTTMGNLAVTYGDQGKLVLESLVQSAFLAQKNKTKTKTGPDIS